MAEYKKKLIEVALPLDEINAACIREKHIQHGHPATLHRWWARRPLSAARAVTWASLVDDPSSHPDLFPTEESQNIERERLFSILKELVIWENSNNQEVLEKAKAEIMKSTNNNPPAFLDSFAGGGALPFEAQRLGLKTYACDLNPVAVMINKAMISIPSCFQGCEPINPNCSDIQTRWERCTGLAEDVRYYANFLKEIVYKKIGNLYPTIAYKVANETFEDTIMAWLWTRTVQCPNPACNCKIPLIHSTDICKVKGKEKHVELKISENGKIKYEVVNGKSNKTSGTVFRTGGAICPVCGQPVDFNYLREYGTKNGFGADLIAIVAEGKNERVYLNPTDEQLQKAMVEMPKDAPMEELPEKALGFRPQLYGIKKWSQMFTNRQLTLLLTLINSLDEVDKEIKKDFQEKKGSTDYKNYANAVRTYLGFLIDKMTDFNSTFCSWNASMQAMGHVFNRQAIPMIWDFSESNPFCSLSGSYDNMVDWIVKSIENFPENKNSGEARQWDATQDNGLREVMISTDPPYYDNIGYADLSDFFYIWLKKSIGHIYPDLFSTLLTPKSTELIASPFRFDDNMTNAKQFFEDGMALACNNFYHYTREDIPLTIYYAFKQSDSDSDGSVSSGWETMLSAIIKSGFEITGTWPMRTELVTALKHDVSALSTSVVIVCRKNTNQKKDIDLRTFLDILKEEMTIALKKLQASSIAPVDLPQSAIGPGIAVYSRYNSIIQNDGSTLSVRDALKIINRELDQYLNDVNFAMDSETSLALAMYKQKAFDEWQFGEVNNIANAKGIPVDRLEHLGIINSGKGKVSLKERSLLNAKDNHDCLWLTTQLTVKAYETKGLEGVAEIFLDISQNTQTQIKALCYQLFLLADRNGWTSEALAYNDLISSWDESVSTMIAVKARKKEYVQYNLFDNEEV